MVFFYKITNEKNKTEAFLIGTNHAHKLSQQSIMNHLSKTGEVVFETENPIPIDDPILRNLTSERMDFQIELLATTNGNKISYLDSFKLALRVNEVSKRSKMKNLHDDVYNDEFLEAWKTGNERYLEQLHDCFDSKFNKIALDEPHKKWVPELDKKIQRSSSPIFIVVGAMHCVGKNGLIEGLKKRGYTIEKQAFIPSPEGLDL